MSPGYTALHESAAWLDLSDRGRIIANGRDRARLLHNISSNDVKKMMPGDSCYAFLLNPQGRIQADLHLLCSADDFLIDTEPELREKVLQHIRRYIIADQVELEDITVATTAIGVEGPAAGAQPPFPLAEGCFLAPFTITGQPGYRIYAPEPLKGAIIAQLESHGIPRASAEDARLVRIENGKPRYGEDIRDTTLPQETQQMHAVSFTKGCYLGQEIVERIRAQGRVHRKLERVELEGQEVPAPGAKLQVASGETEVTSAIFSPRFNKVIALAYVRAS
jgi:folate-binding protein YgfZ